MKFLTIRALLAAALFSLVVVVPALPPTKTGARWFALEAQLSSGVSGSARVYFQFGDGYTEDDSVGLPLVAGAAPRSYRFELPAGRYRSLRLDLMDRPGAVTVHGPLRIVSRSGRVVRMIPLSEIRPVNDIAALEPAGDRMRIVAAAEAKDPQLAVSFSPPLAVRFTGGDFLAIAWRPALVVFAALVVVLVALDRLPATRRRIAAAASAVAARPARAVMLVAAIAVVLSAYPVVFLGRSYVSPNFGTPLLYERFPTLPGHADAELATVNGSDVGATLWQAVPYGFIQRRALAQGELPLWNRYTLTGTPLLGQGQSMLGDPLHGLVLLFDGAAGAWDLRFLLSKWLFAAGVGLLALAVARHVPSALLVSLAAPFVGLYLYRINHPALFAVGYAPWVLYCWIRLVRADTRRAATGWLVGLLLANVALLNSGTVKEAYLLVAQMNVAGIAVLIASRGPWRAKLGKLAAAAWVGALLLLITAPVWATFVETLPHAYTAAAASIANQIQPSLLLGAFDELFFRHLSPGEMVFNPSLNWLFLLGLLYFAASLRLHLSDRELMALAGCALLFMAVVFGAIPPGWITSVPLLGKVWHVDNCFLSGLLVLWPVLAAVGFRTAASRMASRESRADVIIAALLLFAIVGAWLGFRHAAHRQAYGPGTTISLLEYGKVIPVSSFLQANLAVLLVATAALAITAQHALQRKAIGAGGAIVVALCMIVLLWRHGAQASRFGFETYLLQPPARVDFHARSDAIAVVQSRQQSEPGRIFGLQSNVTPGWNALYGLEAIHGPDAIQHLPVRELMEAAPVKWGSGWSLYMSAHELGAVRPLFDALNVRYYLDLPANASPTDPSIVAFHKSDLAVYESRTAWPRAFFTDSLSTYRDPAELVKKFASQGRPFAGVSRDELATHPELSRLRVDAENAVTAPAKKYRLTTNTTSFSVRSDRPGIVVLAEAWWPGAFRATVNGRRVPVLRVNHAFKGVLIDSPGEHEVTFAYWPDQFSRYLALHAAGVLLAAVSALAGFAGMPPRLRRERVAVPSELPVGDRRHPLERENRSRLPQ